MSNVREEVLNLIDEELNKADGTYLILRDSHKKTDGDVDILISDHNRARIVRFLCRQQNYHIVRIARYFNALSIWLVDRRDVSCVVQLDLMSEMSIGSNRYIPFQEAFAHPRFSQFLAMLLPSALYSPSNMIKPQYIETARELFNQHENAIAAEMAELLPAKCIEKIDRLLAGENVQFVDSDFAAAKSTFIKKRSLAKLKRLFDVVDSGSVQRVVFLGPDGAGKSSLIEQMQPVLTSWSKKHRLLHLKPIIFFAKRHEDRGVVNAPHAKEPRDALSSALKLLSYLAEYWIDATRQLRSSHRIDIFDRHLWDIQIDPRRYRFKSTSTLGSLVAQLTPPIDQIFVLTADAEIIQSRKQEVSFDESVRAVRAYREFANNNANALHIDSAASIRQCAETALKSYAEKLHRRHVARLLKTNVESARLTKEPQLER